MSPKISETKNRIVVHIAKIWQTYDTKYGRENFKFRVHSVGRKGYTNRIAVKYHNKWHTYAWSFLKSQVSKSGRTLICKDKKAYDILSKMKEGGDLRGYKVVMSPYLIRR